MLDDDFDSKLILTIKKKYIKTNCIQNSITKKIVRTSSYVTTLWRQSIYLITTIIKFITQKSFPSKNIRLQTYTRKPSFKSNWLTRLVKEVLWLKLHSQGIEPAIFTQEGNANDL